MVFPRFFYKYQKYFIESDTERDKINYAKRIIRDSELYFPLRYELNDPFECQFNIYHNGKLIKAAWEYKLESGEFEGVEKKLRDNEKNVFNEFGILALTTKKDDIIMFSHYADYHRGICLEFDSAKDKIFKDAFAINYVDSLPSFELIPYLRKAINFESIFFSKFKHWIYENEWRVLNKNSSNENPRIEKFNPEALTGIIFGCKSDDLIKREIKELIKFKKHKISLYQAIPKKDRYGLDIIRSDLD